MRNTTIIGPWQAACCVLLMIRILCLCQTLLTVNSILTVLSANRCSFSDRVQYLVRDLRLLWLCCRWFVVFRIKLQHNVNSHSVTLSSKLVVLCVDHHYLFVACGEKNCSCDQKMPKKSRGCYCMRLTAVYRD